MQYSLFKDETRTKRIEEIPIDKLSISQYNPRKTRSKDYIEKLAERINHNGYEITRALWVYPNNGKYEVFAGGTRLEASKIAGLDKVPSVIHDGYSDEEIIKLADEDNENDEYHEKVSITDMWASYKALADQGWTQERIAKAKGVSQNFVSYRINLAELPESVLDKFITTPNLNERHGRELLRLSPGDNLEQWITREQIMLEIIKEIGDYAIADKFKKKVDKYNKLIEIASGIADKLDPNDRKLFIQKLADKEVRSQSGIKDIASEITYIITERKKREEEKRRLQYEQAEKERIEAERKERLAKYRDQWFADNAILYHGDLLEASQPIKDESVDFIFTDPPYDRKSVADYEKLAILAARVLKPGGSLITYAGHYALPDIFELMTPHLNYVWTIALIHTGGTSSVPGANVRVKWKPLLWFAKDGERSTEFIDDLFVSKPPEKELHEWEQDISEAQYYIEHLSKEGDTILDPFLGSGTTLLAAVSIGRKGIGIDRQTSAIDISKDRLDEYFSERFESLDIGE